MDKQISVLKELVYNQGLNTLFQRMKALIDSKSQRVEFKKVFETREGVALFFDEENYDYFSDDMLAVETALKEDMSNYETDPQGAALAHNLMAMMQSMDFVRKSMC